MSDKKIESIEGLLSILPEALRSKYVLIFQSRSLQGASFKDPRVVLYSSDAKFMLAFNGDSNQRGFQNIETIEFNNDTKQFIFHEIQFSKPESNQVAVRFSGANPEKCLKCHGNPARPVWDTHPMWPGAYGEVYHKSLTNAESEGLAQFLAHQVSHPRYRFLKKVDTFSDRENLSPTTHSRYEGTDQKLPPNENLSSLLTDLNLQMIARQVATNTNFRRFQYALLGALDTACSPTENYFAKELRPQLKTKIDFFEADTKSKNTEQSKNKQSRLSAGPEDDSVTSSADIIDLNRFRFLVEKGLMIQTSDWTLTLEKNTYDFSALQSSTKALENYLLPYIYKNDSTLRHLNSLRSVSSDEKYCRELKNKSDLAIFEVNDRPPTDANRLTSLLQSCGHCHDDVIAQKIAFDQPVELKKIINSGSFKRGSLLNEILFRISKDAKFESMPRGINLNEENRLLLERYFRQIADN